MLISAKINLKKYLLYSLVLLLISKFAVRSFAEFGIVLLVFIASCVNHWMLIFIVKRLSESAIGLKPKYGGLVPLMNVAKLFLVIGALSFGVQVMGKRILIPILIYILQIVVLYLSFEKTV